MEERWGERQDEAIIRVSRSLSSGGEGRGKRPITRFLPSKILRKEK